MPYITKNHQYDLANRSAISAGELNFLITSLLVEYYKNCGPSYSAINDIMGALEGAKIEFYRRVVVPYEDNKRDENGDVY